MSLALATRERQDSYWDEDCIESTPDWSRISDVDNYLKPAPVLEEIYSRITYSLGDVLAELRGHDFAERLSHLQQGREEHTLSTDVLVRRLIRCVESEGGSADATIESFLDQLFRDLRNDEDFEHTEVVMALLYALKHGRSSIFPRVATVLVTSRAAELGRLSRFAKALFVR
jgi:hypothetical protein